MENVPTWLDLAFAGITFTTAGLMLRAADHRRTLLFALLAWGVLTGVLGVRGFYTETSGTPPRFAMLGIVPLVVILVTLATGRGRRSMRSFDPALLTLLHVIRIPVELVLYGLFVYGKVPELMTFSGRNLDIISGLTAPFVYQWGYRSPVLPRWAIISWNIACLGLLANIVTNAVLSAPFVFQTQAFDQPNVAILHFPYVWLPAIVVPAVLFAHLAVLVRPARDPRG